LCLIKAALEQVSNYEIIQTVAPADFESIATIFGVDPIEDILSVVQEISDSGRGGELINALNSKEIKIGSINGGATQVVKIKVAKS
jgi:hypothetical protein